MPSEGHITLVLKGASQTTCQHSHLLSGLLTDLLCRANDIVLQVGYREERELTSHYFRLRVCCGVLGEKEGDAHEKERKGGQLTSHFSILSSFLRTSMSDTRCHVVLSSRHAWGVLLPQPLCSQREQKQRDHATAP